jgi:hypothetical protein
MIDPRSLQLIDFWNGRNRLYSSLRDGLGRYSVHDTTKPRWFAGFPNILSYTGLISVFFTTPPSLFRFGFVHAPTGTPYSYT